ncbi:MAG: ATP-dependent RecD-like DNA helicase, partial [Anaerolineae bacterium]|nr:ATP-dependent RecD-like DNA helicase [Anaerolineae bacterium]
MESLTGSVERITFYNPENGYTVLRLRPSGELPSVHEQGLVTVTGNLPELNPGERVQVEGEWSKHPKHGTQFSAARCDKLLPISVEGIRRYLGSGLLPGVGPKLAERIVDAFGAETLDVIEEQPERLTEVPDIGPKRSGQIIAAWEQQKQVKEIMLFLHDRGITTNLAVKIYKHYGDDALQVVRENPYQLAADIFGIGFKTADGIARSLGLPKDHPTRMDAGLLHTLDEMNRNGHVYSPVDELLAAASELLNAQKEELTSAITRLVSAESVVVETAAEDGRRAYLAPFFHAERGAAFRLKELIEAHPTRLGDLPPTTFNQFPDLSPEQQQAVRTAFQHPVSVLTGGPGTGKTTAVKALIAAIELSGKRFALASPTGRAAKRLSEATGRSASTIHRLLAYSPRDGFGVNEHNPLPVDLLVVDETSMLDLLLANHLFKALPPGAHLLLVGDVDQLPAVGAGDVLRDIIASEAAPVTRLSVIFRQEAGSQIISNAHLINQGSQPDFAKDSRDFFLFTADSPDKAAAWVEDLVTNRIPDRFGLQPLQDIQVLVPMYRGPAGIDALNQRLQDALNPAGSLTPQHGSFRPGDKLMQIRNDYDKQVYNGDIGYLKDISSVDHTLTVEFEGRGVTYDFTESDQLVLAYAVSVHKAQGSEFP